LLVSIVVFDVVLRNFANDNWIRTTVPHLGLRRVREIVRHLIPDRRTDSMSCDRRTHLRGPLSLG
jgi:hypothetical protein